MSNKKSTWKQIGEFKRTSKAHIFAGTITLPDTGVTIKACIFLKTSEVKIKSSAPDMTLLLPDFEEEKAPDNLFD